MSISSILIIEDEKTLASNIRRYLERYDYDVGITESGNEALNQMVVSTPDLVLLDLKLPDMNGLDILTRIRKFEPKIKIIMMTAFGDVDTAVTAMKEGASDFLTKPLKLTKLKELMDRVLLQPVDDLDEQSNESKKRYLIEELIGEHASIVKIKQEISQLLESESRVQHQPPPVLVTGQTGTGKELVARALHFRGMRAQAPFLSLSGTMLTPELLNRCNHVFESNRERNPNRSILDSVGGGTLYLDEIADASLEAQAMLVDLISERDPSNLGRLSDRESDIRIIASTRYSLEDLVQTGNFRSDLYFRLHVINIDLPPLCQRNEDVLILAEHFLSIFAQRYGKTQFRFDTEAKNRLMRYTWPGNVRELRNLIEQAVLLSDTNIVEARMLNIPDSRVSVRKLEKPFSPEISSQDSVLLVKYKEETERETLIGALERGAWNVSLVARILGVSRDTLRYRIRKHNLKRPTT